MKTTLALLVLFFVVLGGGYALYTHNQAVALQAPSAANTQTSVMASTTGNGSPAVATIAAATAGSAPGTYTPEQVAAHNTNKSCWTSINGNVYDLTQWIGQHPGGEAAILSICGKDGTSAFEGQHGNPRDTRPQQMLATFRIGVLAS